jgi:hypothetical protein
LRNASPQSKSRWISIAAALLLAGLRRQLSSRAAFLFILPLTATLTHCTDTSNQLSENKYIPWPVFVSFKIESALPPDQLTDTLYGLFEQHPVLQTELPCYRFGENNRRFGCLKVIREDVFHTRFEADIQTLTVSIVPRTTDRSYRPDYRHFEELKNSIAEMLAARFGSANVTMK